MFTVLVVDGDDRFLSLFRQDADTWAGVKIDTASGIKEAEEYLRNTPCDMVISEYALGEKNGIDLLRYIRSRHGEIPFILLASHGSEEIAAEASRFGISAYFMKKGDFISLFSEVYGKIRVEMKRKESVENLKERESRCRTILESQPGLICRFGPDLILTFVNRAFTQLMEASPENLIGTCITDYIQPEDRNTFTNAIRTLTPGSHSATLDIRILSPHNNPEESRLTAWTFTAAFRDEYTPAVIQGMGMDISTEREHAEEQARQLENLAFLSQTAMEFVDMEDSDDIFQFIAEKVHSLLPHSVVGVVMHDHNNNSVILTSVVGESDVFEAFRKWFGSDLIGWVWSLDKETFADVGYSMKGIHEGPPLYHFLLQQFPEERCHQVEKSCSLGKNYYMGFSCHGERFGNVSFTIRKGDTIQNPELLEAFMNQASVALLRWKTRKTAEEEIAKVHAGLEQAVAERTAALQAANRNLESFSYSVSHDLRAPLRSIEGFSSIFLNRFGKDLPPDGRELVEKVRQNTARMADLIDDILEFSRSGRKEIQKEQIDMKAMVREVLDELASLYPGQEIKPVISDLPPCMADPVLLRQVLQNLLANAVKFSRCMDISRIEVGSFTDDGQPVYYIRDNGIGFDMKYADRLFKVFERLHDGREYEGTGIGLAIVDQIVRRHGGRVWAESDIDRGSTFYFTIGGTEETKTNISPARTN